MTEHLPSDTAIPVTILTGFLGSGKTTLLNHILTGDHGLRVAVLVNDFGAINIDADLIVGVEDDMISLANGCVCCQVRDDLIEAVDQLLEQPRPVEYILLEASGVADPGSIYITFSDPKYRERIRVDSITCVVDAEQVLNDDDPEPVQLLKLRQIGFADLLILNKTDLAGDEQIAGVKAWVDGHLNRVRIVEAEHCHVPLEILLGVGRFDPAGQLPDTDGKTTNHGKAFSRWSFETTEPISVNALREMIKRRLPAAVCRCKGLIHSAETPDRRTILQVVGRRSDITIDRHWGDELPVTRIVAIGSADSIDCDELNSLFQSCIVGRQPESPSSTGGVRTVRI